MIALVMLQNPLFAAWIPLWILRYVRH